ncbi:hypothetical protein AVMA1855_14310 [Acidovorax sp. SUPP1855]|nr:hypothetical protein AVMA1855_14310 [Acidovorax sp. SUPP1855]
MDLVEFGVQRTESIHRGLVVALSDLPQQVLRCFGPCSDIAPQLDKAAHDGHKLRILRLHGVQPLLLRRIGNGQLLGLHPRLVEFTDAGVPGFEKPFLATEKITADAGLHVDHAAEQGVGCVHHFVSVDVQLLGLLQLGTAVQGRRGDSQKNTDNGTESDQKSPGNGQGAARGHVNPLWSGWEVRNAIFRINDIFETKKCVSKNI